MGLAAAVGITAVAFSASSILTSVAVVGAVVSVAGAITKNPVLSDIGLGLGVVGGIGALASAALGTTADVVGSTAAAGGDTLGSAGTVAPDAVGSLASGTDITTTGASDAAAAANAPVISAADSPAIGTEALDGSPNLTTAADSAAAPAVANAGDVNPALEGTTAPAGPGGTANQALTTQLQGGGAPTGAANAPTGTGSVLNGNSPTPNDVGGTNLTATSTGSTQTAGSATGSGATQTAGSTTAPAGSPLAAQPQAGTTPTPTATATGPSTATPTPSTAATASWDNATQGSGTGAGGGGGGSGGYLKGLLDFANAHPMVAFGAAQGVASLVSGWTSSLTPAQVAQLNAQAAANQAAANLTTQQTQNLQQPKAIASTAPVTGTPQSLVPAGSAPGFINSQAQQLVTGKPAVAA